MQGNTSEQERASIVSELEEMLTQNSLNNKAHEIGYSKPFIYPDEYSNIEKLNISERKGVDRYFSFLPNVTPTAQMPKSDRLVSDSQLDYFLRTLHLTEAPASHGSEDNEYSVSSFDKILSLDMPDFVQPLYDHLNQTNLPLYNLLLGCQNTDSKHVRKQSRNVSAAKVGRLKASLKQDKTFQSVIEGGEELNHSEKTALGVAKALVDKTSSSILSAVSTLLISINDDEVFSIDCNVLPLGNLMGGLFIGESDSENNENSGNKRLLRCPFELFNKLVGLNNDTDRSESDLSKSYMLSGDRTRDETISLMGSGGAMVSDAGSTVGSTFVKLGTETASVVDDEPTEDDILAQALSLSMADPLPTHSNPCSIDKTYNKFQPINLEASVKDTIWYADNNLPCALPLSSWGLFCNKEFWFSLYGSSVYQDRLSNNLIPIRHTITALLTALNCSVDNFTKERNIMLRESDMSDSVLPDSLRPSLSPSTFIKIECSAETLGLSVFLLEHLINTLASFTKNYDSKINDDTARVDYLKQWFLHYHFLWWSLHSVLRVVKIVFENMGHDRSLTSVLFRSSIANGPEQSLGAFRGIFHRLRAIVSSMSGVRDLFPYEEGTMLELQLPDALEQVHQAQSKVMNCEESLRFNGTMDVVDCGTVIINALYTPCYLGHVIRLTSIEAFAASTKVFSPEEFSKWKLLEDFLEMTPICAADPDYSLKFYLSMLTGEQGSSASSTHIAKVSSLQIWPQSWYENYFLQFLCVYTLAADDLLLQYWNELHFGKVDTLTSLRIARMKDLNLKKTKATTFKDILLKMLRRLRQKPIESSWKVHKGELICMQCLQICLMDICRSEMDKINNISAYEFSAVKVHPCLSIARDKKTILHTGLKVWSSALSSLTLPPNSGTYEWAVRIDKCTKGHVFLGIASDDAATSANFIDAYYVGIDKNGWGLIGTRSLWHNKSKLVTDFGGGFSTGSIVNLRYNSDAGTLAYRTNDVEWMIAFESLPNVLLYPAFSLHENGDQISLLFAQRVFGETRQVQNCDMALHMEEIISVYSTELLGFTESILALVDDGTKTVVHNPMFGLILSSLLSFLLKNDNIFRLQFYVRILPILLILSRRLAEIALAIHNQSACDSNPNVKGEWIISTLIGISGSNTSHSLHISVDTEVPLKSLIQESNSSLDSMLKTISRYAILTGSAKSTAGQTSNLVGYRFNDKVKLVIKDASVGNKFIDGTLSFCGSIIVGKSFEEKSGKYHFCEGNRSYSARVQDSTTALVVCANLAAAAAVKLSTFLMLPLQMTINHTVDTIEVDMNITIDPAIDEVSMVDRNQHMVDFDSKLGDHEHNPDTSEDKFIGEWLRTTLFSAGLKLTARTINDIMAYLSDLIPAYNNSLDNKLTPDDVSLMKSPYEVRNFYQQTWIDMSIADLYSRQEKLKLDLENATINAEDDFYISVKLGKGDGDMLDNYLSRYAGQQSLLKLGGGVMQHTRRLVLATLIQRSGCYPICLATSRHLAASEISHCDRPLSVLVDIWSALHRVIERIVKNKQETGQSYDIVCGIICQKAKFLEEVEINSECLSLRNELELLDTNQLLSEKYFLESGLPVKQKCNILATEVIDFLLSSVKGVGNFRNQLVEVNCSALLRLSGFRSVQILMGKLNKPLPNVFTQGTSGSGMSFIDRVLTYLPYKFVGKVNDGEAANNLGEHYLAGLRCVNYKLADEVKLVFEQSYEAFTQHLSRSTWNGDQQSQSLALLAWNILVHPQEHMFLNRISLFNVFHNVLDHVRQCLLILPSAILNNFTLADSAFEKDNFKHEAMRDGAKLAFKSIVIQNKKIANLVLTTVHCLSVQVASVRDCQHTDLKTIRWQRARSGPDTLSKSLFDLMFAELQFAITSTLEASSIDSVSIKSDASCIDESAFAGDSLHGEDYICRILRLLRLVSDSKVCQKELSSSKWLSLLLSLVGHGTVIIQRRVLRLLHRLLVSVDPMLLVTKVPTTFMNSGDKGYSLENFGEFDCNQPQLGCGSDAAKVIKFFFKCICVVFPETTTTKSSEVKMLCLRGMAESLAAESLLLLRVLFGIPSWRKLIIDYLVDSCESSIGIEGELIENFDSAISSFSFMGGFIEKRRLGGFVMLKPFCLVGSSENYATKLAAASHSCGMVVSQSISTSSVEVILMDRNVKMSKADDGRLLLQHTLSLSGSLPIRSVRLPSSDVLPCADVPFVPSLANIKLVEKLRISVQQSTLSWIDNGKHINRLHVLGHIIKLRAFSAFMQVDQFIDNIIQSDAHFFIEVLSCSILSVTTFSLATLEAGVDFFYELFEPSADGRNIELEKNIADINQPETEKGERPSANLHASSSPLREIIAMLTPREAFSSLQNNNTQAVDAGSLAQMLEIGLAREWCEFALKRCRNNVELAINFCLEHGDDIEQMIAQETAATASRANRLTAPPQRRTIGRFSSSAEQQSLLREDSSSTNRSGNVESQAMIRQLLDMGFPPNWCVRAIESNQSNLDAALGWILTHDEELLSESREAQKSAVIEGADNETGKISATFNPLTIISGSSEIRQDYTCSTSGGFPSVGCRSYPVSHGKWYYELVLLTAGCVQVGWSSVGFLGGAESGQGVGDDILSWAFDGWRTYLWHETSVEWGARWATGDTVGCAIDLDNRVMSFYLNGLGEEVGMGIAFTQFDSTYESHLQVFPCASFNRNEKIKFNFSSASFKYDPPPGYRPYSEHFDSFSASHLGENALEEFSENSFMRIKRLFYEEQSISNEDTNYFNFAKPLSGLTLVEQIQQYGREICILYCRLIVLRFLRKIAKIPEASQEVFSNLSLSRGLNEENGFSEHLLKLIRLMACNTGRSKIYYNVMHSLPPYHAPPQNLGSIFCVGGFQLLLELRECFLILLRKAISSNGDAFMDDILTEIKRNITYSSTRENNKISKDIIPTIYLDTNFLSDEKIIKTPSLQVAVWLTEMLLELIHHSIATYSQMCSHILYVISESWILAVQSPHLSVKLCGLFMLNIVVHCLDGLEKNHKLNLSEVLKSLYILAARLRQQALNLLESERMQAPVFSHYLQYLLELSTAISIKHVDSSASLGNHANSSSLLRSEFPSQSPFVSHDDEQSDENFYWEGVSGRALIDKEGWQTWSGELQIQPLDVSLSPYPNALKLVERQDFPPELMPGCKVVRRNSMNHTASDFSQQTVESGSSSDTISRLRMIFDRGLSEQGEKSHQDKLACLADERIGTVKSVCNWPGESVKGTARVIIWDDNQEEELVRWGAENKFDVCHIAMKNGKITNLYPNPTTHSEKLSHKGFGSGGKCGLILRIRRFKPNLVGDITAMIEWPEFSSTVLAHGRMIDDRSLELEEQLLLYGSKHSGWERLRGKASWEPGLRLSLVMTGSAVASYSDIELTGSWEHSVSLFGEQHKLYGRVELQQLRLFSFDENCHSPNIMLSRDKASVSKIGGGPSQGIVFGSVGFARGVHMWELKIEQADVGTIFVGVAEKPPDLKISRLGRWIGLGFVNNRVSFSSATLSASDKSQVYGDHFHSGDLVSVILDLNSGKLSFFLDGMKYGEHTIADLGSAFNNLLVPSSVKPKVFYPVIGLGKNMDRVTITPRWVSSVGVNANEQYFLYKRAYSLLLSWQPKTERSCFDSWVYHEAWRNYRQLMCGSQYRMTCRASSVGLTLVLDTSLMACAEASIRLGLMKCLLPGDRIAFLKSSGRVLGAREDGIILGAFQGKLWYKLDAQVGSSFGSSEALSAAWCLMPSDVEGFHLLMRSDPMLSAHNVLLPRLPQYKGGLIVIMHETGAVMRDGIEIDNSEIICTVPKGTALYAMERRQNASNINRFFVCYNHKCGWISERMRGGAEERMVEAIVNVSVEEIEIARQAVLLQCKKEELLERLQMTDASCIQEALEIFQRAVNFRPHSKLPLSLSFEKFCIGLDQANDFPKKQWNLEMDIRLSEAVSKYCAVYSLHPANLGYKDGELLMKMIHTDSKLLALHGLELEPLLARLCLLRVANSVLMYTLPYFQLELPEDRIIRRECPSNFDVDIIPSLPVSRNEPFRTWQDGIFNWAETFDCSVKEEKQRLNWKPFCLTRQLLSLRQIMFTSTKHAFWDAVLVATTTSTPPHQDEYEDPREIKLIKINRIKATQSRLLSFKSSADRIKHSLFGQLHRELRGWPAGQFRRSYVGKGHGGQRRAFKVKFLGEGVNDYGGPYRAVFEQIVDELQCDLVVTGGAKVSDRCLLPLLIPSPNKISLVGTSQDKYLLNTSPLASPITQELMVFFGKVVGMAVRHHLSLALDLSHLVWRPLVRLPLAMKHLESVDNLFVKSVQDIIDKGMELERSKQDTSFVPDEWQDLCFCCVLPDGTRVPLCPGGADISVNVSNWKGCVHLLEMYRLQESRVMLRAFKEGLAAVLPVELLPLFSAFELDSMVCGNREVDIEVIKKSAEYEGFEETDEVVQNFWAVLEEMSSEEKTLFLRFVWARSRLPGMAKELPMSFKLQKAQGLTPQQTDGFLPHAQTCFFSLAIPGYSSKQILKEKLLYAIRNSPNMDADVRLHNAEGWNEV